METKVAPAWDTEFIMVYRHIASCDRLKESEKLVFSIIVNFCKDDKRCIASNQYLADRVGLPLRKLERVLARLKRGKFIQCEYNGRHRVEIMPTQGALKFLHGEITLAPKPPSGKEKRFSRKKNKEDVAEDLPF